MEKNLSHGLEKMGLAKLGKRVSNNYPKKGDIEKVKAENNQLRNDISQCKVKMTELTAQLERMEREKEKARSGEKELREKKWKDFQKQMEELEDEHTRQMQELEKNIEELQSKIEEKNRSEGFFKVGVLFGDGYDKEDQTDVHQSEQQVNTGQVQQPVEVKTDPAAEKKDEQKYNDDGILEDYQEDTQMSESTYKVTYKHQHKHNHIHILNHRHTHYHNDTAEKPVVYTQTETLAHTIVHTGTQFQIKRNVLG